MHPKRRKLLIVDDEIDACRPAQNFFKKRDFEVVTTANGSDALMLISTFMPDLVLLDLTLEYSMSGVDVLRELRELDKDTKVIIVSANDDKKMKEELYSIGIQGFCHKPYLLEDLEETVYETLGLEFNAKKVDVGEYKENLEGSNLIPGSSHELGNKLGPISNYDWNDIVLSGGLANRIKSEVEGVIRCAKELNRYGLNSKKGFILAGDPGNGKTLLLKILANTIKATCIMVPFNKTKDELNMPALFRLARELAPTILILEDIDLYGEEREVAKDAERLGELMNELDGMVDNKEIIVFATTNNLIKVEKALQSRPGRFDRIYKIMNPDFNGRLQILKHFVNKVPHEITDNNISTLAEEFEGYSGAYLKELINSGFAQAILRDDQKPVLRFNDLVETSVVLKNKDGNKFLGFGIKEESPVAALATVQVSEEVSK